jgi:hypothetical protein
MRKAQLGTSPEVVLCTSLRQRVARDFAGMELPELRKSAKHAARVGY